MTYVGASARKKLGHVTPSCNSVLEPMSVLITAEIPAVSHHFSRIQVDEVSLRLEDLAQFAPDRILAGARLLADAQLDAIVWNGTSGAWHGLDQDYDLCNRIEAETGCPASTAILAQVEALQRGRLRHYGLAVPYTADVAARMADVFAEADLEVAAVGHGSITKGTDMARMTDDDVRGLLRTANAPGAECIALVCTGVAGAHLVHEMEAELGKPIIDSVAAACGKGLELAGVDARLDGWGLLLSGALIGAPERPSSNATS